MTRRPDAIVQSIEQLKTRKVGTIRGTFMEEELAAAGVTNVDTSIATGELPAALKTARIEAAVDGLEAAALNAYISNVRRTSTWSRLVVKYFGPSSLEILNKARGQ